MRIEGPVVDQMFEEFKEYEKKNFGVTMGPDFPEIAQALVTSDFGKSQLAATLIMVTLTLPSIARKAKTAVDEGRDNDAVGLFEGSDNPFRTAAATIFYTGYRLGRKAAEVDLLEKEVKQNEKV